MFLHDRKELPMVRDLGFAVPPGRHSLIDVRYSSVSQVHYSLKNVHILKMPMS